MVLGGGGGGFMPINISYIVFGPGWWGVAQILIYAHWSWQRDAQIFVFAQSSQWSWLLLVAPCGVMLKFLFMLTGPGGVLLKFFIFVHWSWRSYAQISIYAHWSWRSCAQILIDAHWPCGAMCYHL